MRNDFEKVRLELNDILLDIDDVLIDCNKPTETSWEVALRNVQIPHSDLQEAIRFLRSGKAKNRVQELLDRYGQSVDPYLVLKAYREAFCSLPKELFVPYDGAVSAVEQLYQNGFRLFVVTNRLSDLASYILQCIGLHDILPRERVVCGDEVKEQKPTREPLELAIKRFGLTPQYSGLVEDSLPALRTASEIGFRTIYIQPNSKIHPEFRPDITLPSVAYLPQHVKRL